MGQYIILILSKNNCDNPYLIYQYLIDKSIFSSLIPYPELFKNIDDSYSILIESQIPNKYFSKSSINIINNYLHLTDNFNNISLLKEQFNNYNNSYIDFNLTLIVLNSCILLHYNSS